jgi:2-polyprenyl-3-methyl-5-hydroxy-6-metoxy-1,4-benzoquinol methylase
MSLNYYKNIRYDVLEIAPKISHGKVMEIGGGDFPTLIKYNDKKFNELWGVDNYPSKRKGIRFIYGSVEDDKLKKSIPSNYFDLIFANDVLEHLTDPEAFFSFVYQKLNQNGIFVLSVPNIRQLRTFYHVFLRGTFPRNEAGLFDKTHLRWFCKKDILNLALNSRFDILDYKAVGKLVPKFMEKNQLAEFLALQNLFVCKKI